MAANDVESQPFLPDTNFKRESGDHVKTKQLVDSLSSRRQLYVLSHCFAIGLGFLASMMGPWNFHDATQMPSTIHVLPERYSPLEPLVEYTTMKTNRDYWNAELYFKSYDAESEAAWDKITKPPFVQLKPEEYQPYAVEPSVETGNGNSLFILGYQHNLHCLRRIRQLLQADHYYANKDKSFQEHDLEHALHCLEALRTSMMCEPDLAIHSLYWSGNPLHNLTVNPGATRSCADWNALTDFTHARTYKFDVLNT